MRIEGADMRMQRIVGAVGAGLLSAMLMVSAAGAAGSTTTTTKPPNKPKVVHARAHAHKPKAVHMKSHRAKGVHTKPAAKPKRVPKK
jgi:hypothetical protein